MDNASSISSAKAKQALTYAGFKWIYLYTSLAFHCRGLLSNGSHAAGKLLLAFDQEGFDRTATYLATMREIKELNTIITLLNLPTVRLLHSRILLRTYKNTCHAWHVMP